MRLAAQAKGGFYPTPVRVAEMIAQEIETPYVSADDRKREDVIRMLDPCCGEGEALRIIAQGMRDNWKFQRETFGAELHRQRAEQARDRLDRVMNADIFQASIGHGNFGLMLLNPPYDNEPERGRAEYSFLAHCTRYLAPGGLLLLIVPLIRLGACARHLAAHYRDLEVRSFPDPEWEDFNQVLLTGKRRFQAIPDPQMEKDIREWARERPGPIGEGEKRTYRPIPTPGGRVLFAARGIDPQEAALEARRAGLWASQELTEALWPPLEGRVRPLMPLRRGHMAMLMAAGLLNNMQLESQGKRVLVKGRTSKEKVLVEATPAEEVYQDRLRTTVTALDLETGEIQEIRT